MGIETHKKVQRFIKKQYFQELLACLKIKHKFFIQVGASISLVEQESIIPATN
jgi:hypothetical protein